MIPKWGLALGAATGGVASALTLAASIWPQAAQPIADAAFVGVFVGAITISLGMMLR